MDGEFNKKNRVRKSNTVFALTVCENQTRFFILPCLKIEHGLNPKPCLKIEHGLNPKPCLKIEHGVRVRK